MPGLITSPSILFLITSRANRQHTCLHKPSTSTSNSTLNYQYTKVLQPTTMTLSRDDLQKKPGDYQTQWDKAITELDNTLSKLPSNKDNWAEGAGRFASLHLYQSILIPFLEKMLPRRGVERSLECETPQFKSGPSFIFLYAFHLFIFRHQSHKSPCSCPDIASMRTREYRE